MAYRIEAILSALLPIIARLRAGWPEAIELGSGVLRGMCLLFNAQLIFFDYFVLFRS
jgi:hypothetical protein